MNKQTLQDIIQWVAQSNNQSSLDITFHGGEPLIPGIEFYQTTLQLLKGNLKPRKVTFSVQSNLWLLTDELCRLFCEYDVSLGTSLDGPESINDAQRGKGYFQRTMGGIRIACSHGLNVGCICTFTKESANQLDDIFNFFLSKNLGFSVHAAQLPLGSSNGSWAMSPEMHGQLLVSILDRYLDIADKIRISTLDAMIRSVSTRKAGTCTFGDCLGEYWAVDPAGWIYSCQRFAGIPQYRLGHVSDHPTKEDLAQAPFWQALAARQQRIDDECGDCPYLAFCRGGCPYNVLAANGGHFEDSYRDPHCPAYKRIFSEITDRALAEVFSEENIATVAAKGPDQYRLMQKGNLLHIMRGGPHPQETARKARKVVAAAALGVSANPQEALHKLDRVGIITQPTRALGSLKSMQHDLKTQSQKELINIYLHVTYRCNLECTHCYARSDPGKSDHMAPGDIASLVHQAAEAGFRKAVLTGGEPMLHPQCDQLLASMKALRGEVEPLKTVLRTNLAYPLSDSLIQIIAHSTDQVVVSVDGSRESHDARRGAGTYDRTVGNLHRLLDVAPEAEIRITMVLTADQQSGPEGAAVRALGEELGIQTRVKSLLPLGRAQEINLLPNYYSSLEEDADPLVHGARPAATCGLGMNLYVGPEGACYPCYTLMADSHNLGNVFEVGLPAILDRNDTYRHFTVDSNVQCRQCELRYLCGGFCRAWSSTGDPDSPPLDCSALYARAQRQLARALDVLGVEGNRWEATGLPKLTLNFWRD